MRQWVQRRASDYVILCGDVSTLSLAATLVCACSYSQGYQLLILKELCSRCTFLSRKQIEQCQIQTSCNSKRCLSMCKGEPWFRYILSGRLIIGCGLKVCPLYAGTQSVTAVTVTDCVPAYNI